MYVKFFGFQRRPFDLVPDPDFLFLGESHESALANFELGIQSGKGFIVITGAVGIGKTTILKSALRRIGREADVCFLNQPDLESTELLATILDEFGAEKGGEDKVALRRRLREFLVGRTRPAILVVDEAHLLSEESLEQIRLLSNFEKSDRKLLQIVLAGQPELKELLSRPRLRALAQRIEMFYEIRPLSLGETKSYIQRRIQIAGSPERLSFEPRALEEIHARTGGVPRLINLLAERTLITAYVAGTGTIGPKIVREAFDDLGEVTQRVMGAGEPPALAFEPESDERHHEGRGVARRVEDASDEEVNRAARSASLPTFRRRSWEPKPEESAALSSFRRGRNGRILAAVGLGTLVLIALLSLGTRHAMSSKPGRESKSAVPTSERDSAGGSSESEVTPPAKLAQVEVQAASPSPGASPSSPEASTSASVVELSLPAPAPVIAPKPASTARFAIQCGSFKDRDRAQELAWRLDMGAGEKIRVVSAEMDSGTWHRVLLGSYATQEEAKQRLSEVHAESESLVLQVVRLSSGESAPRPNESE